MSNLVYRPEIDGLRAIAVMSVVLFHISADLLPGGFVGVDIFFVISGFLITSILKRDLETRGSIDYGEFYRRRIRRIFPSLVLVVAFSLAIGLLLLLPSDLVNLARSIPPAMLFLANFHFFSASDYFSPNSNEYPLLHTWSLSIEEQFYLLWPPLLYGLSRLKSKSRDLLILVAIIFSFLYAHYLSLEPMTKQLSYYNPLSRFGEILIGCFLALSPVAQMKAPLKLRSALSFVGLFAILISTFIISENSTFPGFWGLLPCLGAALLIWSTNTPEDLAVKSLLSTRIMKYIGLHSYALYLWHWPVLAFYRYFTAQNDLDLLAGSFCFTISFALSIASRYLIETPLNKSTKKLKSIAVQFFLIPTILLSLGSSYAISTLGMPSRLLDIESMQIEGKYLSDKYCHNTDRTNCITVNGKANRIILFGDSHAGHFIPFWSQTLAGQDYLLYAKTADSCPPILFPSKALINIIETDSKKHCLKLIEEVKNNIDQYDTFILAAHWYGYFGHSVEGFEKSLELTIRFIQEQGKTVIIMGQIPKFNNQLFNSFVRLRHSPLQRIVEVPLPSQDQLLAAREELGKELPIFLQKFSSTQLLYIDMEKTYPEFFERAPFWKNNITYKDAYHLNEWASLELANRYKCQTLQILCTHLQNCQEAPLTEVCQND